MAAQVEGQLFRPLGNGGRIKFAFVNIRQFGQRVVRAFDVSGVVLVVVERHGFGVDRGLQRVVGVGQGRQRVFSTVSHRRGQRFLDRPAVARLRVGVGLAQLVVKRPVTPKRPAPLARAARRERISLMEVHS